MTPLTRVVSAPRLVVVAMAAAALWACQENLPVGPVSFTVAMSVTAWQDTLIVGDTKTSTVRTVDPTARVIEGLHYSFTFSDSSIARFTPDAANTNASLVTALKPGVTTATFGLPDSRFVVPSITKNLRVVVGGVAVSTSHDTTLTAINDTARVIAASLVRTGGAPAYRPGQGVKWVRRGPGAVTVVGTSDTIRIIAKASGVDTLIVSHDFCLAGARCADTVYARVQQTLKLAVSVKTFTAWTFGDSAGPSVILADRRGTGNALASIRLVPVTAADSARVTVTSPLGTTIPATGAMAAPKLVSVGNGTARVAVVGRNPDGSTADSDTITYTIRQIAVRSSVEPLQSQLTEIDTIPVRTVARDIRGFAIGDATFTTDISAGLLLNGSQLTVTTPGTAFTGTMTATVTGIALSSANAGAPDRVVAVDTSRVSVIPAIVYSADATNRTQNIGLLLRAPGGIPLANRWVRFTSTVGVLAADSALTDGSGGIATTWTPPTVARRHVFTAIVPPLGVSQPITDSAGLIVVRRSVVITAGAPVAARSSISIRTATLAAGDTATVTVRVRDAFNNLVSSVVPSDVATVTTGGGLGIMTCTDGVCTAIFTATTIPMGTIEARLGGVLVTGAPLPVAIAPGTPASLVITTPPVPGVGHNALFLPQPILKLVDAYGNTVTASGSFTVTATKNDVVPGPTLAGTVTVAISSGIVTYTNLAFAGAAGTITITFTATDGTTTLTAISGNVVNP